MSLENCAAYVGIDWAEDEHVACVIDRQTREQELHTIKQDPKEIAEWVGKLRQKFPEMKIAVCLEQKRGALIYALMMHECLTLVPVNPSQFASYRAAFKVSGAKDDPGDAIGLAEFVMKHSEQLRAWQPDDVDTREIRLLSQDRRNLVDERTALTNCLQSRLKQYFPLALQVCGSRIYGDIACQLLLRYPCLETLQAASDEQLTDFYRQMRCYHRDMITERLQKIRHAIPLTTDRAIVNSGMLIIESLVKQIIVLNEAIDKYEDQIAVLMAKHPDADIFRSFPGSGPAIAPRLLAAMGSDRDRVEHSKEIAELSGIAPVTKQSGKTRVVLRRWACSSFLRQTFHEHAAHSIKQSAWAKAYYDMMRARGNKHQAAVRALAFKWIRIIYRCWKTRTPYNELIYTTALIKSNSPVLKHLASTHE